MNEIDAKRLDQILVIALQKGVATNKNLPALDNEFLSNQPAIKNKMYSYYLQVIEDKKLAIITRDKEGFEVEPIPIKTQRFIDNGGFVSLFQDSLSEKEKALEHEKLESEIKKLQLKELKGNIFHLKFWWLILIFNAVISLIIALLTKS